GERSAPGGQQHLERQRQQRERERPAIQLGESRIRPRLQGHALQTVDLARDAVEGRRVARTEVPPAGEARDLRQQRIVDLDRTHLVAQSEQAAPYRNGRHAFRSYSYGIDANPQSRRRARGGAWVDGSAIVDAVGEEHHDARRTGRILESIGRGRDRRADRRTVLQLSRLQVADRRVDDGIIGRKRHLCERLARKRHYANAITLSHGDELLDLLARDLEPVLRLKVLRQHRARDVEGDHDV